MQRFPGVSCLLCDPCLPNRPSAQSHAALAFKHLETSAARDFLLLEGSVRLKNVNKFRGSLQKLGLTCQIFLDFFKRISSVWKKKEENKFSIIVDVLMTLVRFD